MAAASCSSAGAATARSADVVIQAQKKDIQYPVFRCGIHNMGNTCFLNASIQVLSRVRRFAQWIRNKGYITTDGWASKPAHLQQLTNQIQDIFDAIRTPSTTSLMPRGFYLRFRGATVAENMGWLMDGQNDSHECMMFLLDAIHKSVSIDIHEREDIAEILKNEQSLTTKGKTSDLREQLDKSSASNWYGHFGKEYSPVMTDMFHGQFLTIITSKQVPDRSFRFEPFSSINLAVPEKGPSNGGPSGEGLISVQDCLDSFFASETMDGEQKWESPSNGKVSAVRGVRIWRLPETLILSLKRFTLTGGKIRTRISYPLTGLNMKPYCTGQALDTNDCVYDLVGVVVHTGMLFGGHYFSFVRNPGGVWVIVNDLRVGAIDIKSVIDNPDAYTLVYHKSSLIPKDDELDASWYDDYKKKTDKEDRETSKSGGSDIPVDTLPSGEDILEDEDDEGMEDDDDERYGPGDFTDVPDM